MLQRAEAARKEIKRLPGRKKFTLAAFDDYIMICISIPLADLVKSLLHRVKSWEEHRSQTFYFDGVLHFNFLRFILDL